MIRWSCQGLQGCVPVAPRRTSCASASSKSCRRRSTMRPAARRRSRSAQSAPRPRTRSARRPDAPPAQCPAPPACSSSKWSAARASGIEQRELLLDGEREILSARRRRRGRCSAALATRPLCASPIDAGTLLERFEQALRDALPRPALDRRPRARRLPAAAARLPGSRGGRGASPAAPPNRPARTRPARGALAYASSSAFATSARPECRGDEGRAAGGRGLGGDHAEGLGEDRGHDDDVRERDQVDEMAVLQLAREQRSLTEPAPRVARDSRRSRR